MVRDPKQIVTPFAFEVHPDLLGLPLATPKRRFAALIIDLLIAAILSSLGNMLLALASTGVFFWLAIRTKNEIRWQNILRYTGATLASIFVFGITLGVLFSTSPDDMSTPTPAVVTADGEAVKTDWIDFSKKITQTDFTDPNDVEALETYAEQMEENVLHGTDSELKNTRYDSLALAQFIAFYKSALTQDSLTTDSLRSLIAANVAAPEISELETRNEIFEERISDLEDRNEDLREKVENPSLLSTIKATGEDFGLTLGWVGIYFILSLALFKGRTLGKKLLSLQVVRLNNKPIGIWFSLERFGGYAAGLATGLLGFFQVYWDPNRQAIHDKIAGTVVVDLREKKKIKVAPLKEKVLQEENLLKD
ncbi:MAG: RDD family protein [Balneolaceae bacterium]|nr:RDD family protein [Balneolaceae bacterium]